MATFSNTSGTAELLFTAAVIIYRKRSLLGTMISLRKIVWFKNKNRRYNGQKSLYFKTPPHIYLNPGKVPRKRRRRRKRRKRLRERKKTRRRLRALARQRRTIAPAVAAAGESPKVPRRKRTTKLWRVFIFVIANRGAIQILPRRAIDPNYFVD